LGENYNVDWYDAKFHGVHIFPKRIQLEYDHSAIEDSGYKNFNPEPLTKEEITILKQIGKDFGIDDIETTYFVSSESS
jgi:hypothetical protein